MENYYKSYSQDEVDKIVNPKPIRIVRQQSDVDWTAEINSAYYLVKAILLTILTFISVVCGAECLHYLHYLWLIHIRLTKDGQW